jgi:hypothetical protein
MARSPVAALVASLAAAALVGAGAPAAAPPPASLDYRAVVTYKGTVETTSFISPADRRLRSEGRTRLDWTVRARVRLQRSSGPSFHVDARGKLDHGDSFTTYQYCKVGQREEVKASAAVAKAFTGPLTAAISVEPERVFVRRATAVGTFAYVKTGTTVHAHNVPPAGGEFQCEVHPVPPVANPRHERFPFAGPFAVTTLGVDGAETVQARGRYGDRTISIVVRGSATAVQRDGTTSKSSWVYVVVLTR